MKVNVLCKTCGKKELVFKSRADKYKYCSTECMSKAYLKNYNIEKGQVVNNWIISSEKPIRKHGRLYVEAICLCGSGVREFLQVRLVKDGKPKGCSGCSKHTNFKGYGEITGEHWALIKSGAVKRGINFNLTIEEAWEVFLNQERKCNLSKTDIYFQNDSSRTNGKRNFHRTASLDRIDSTKGYIKDNVQWLHKDVNLMKNKFEQNYFIDFCKKICKAN